MRDLSAARHHDIHIHSGIFVFDVVQIEQGTSFQNAYAHGGHGGNDGSVETVRREGKKTGRNDPCPCGSGKKYKKCHGAQASPEA